VTPGKANNIELLRCYSCWQCRLDDGDHDDDCAPASAPADVITDAGRTHAAPIHSTTDRRLFVALVLRSGAPHFTLFV